MPGRATAGRRRKGCALGAGREYRTDMADGVHEMGHEMGHDACMGAGQGRLCMAVATRMLC